MRKTIITTLIHCLFFLSINNSLSMALIRQKPPPQAIPARTIGRAEVYYYSKLDSTKVSVHNLTIWGKNDNRIDLHMSYLTLGTKPRLPESIQIDIASIAKTHRFKGKSEIEFIVDGKKWEPISVEPKIVDESYSVVEDYVFLLKLEQFRQIGKAKSVVLKVGGVEVVLSAKHRQAFLDMLRAAE
jgi:hypothetical protein